MAIIAVIGTNYVGLVTAACFAELGNQVVGIDIDPGKVERLARGQLPIYEPGLEEVVVQNIKAGRLRFTLDYVEGLSKAEFAFVCVGTPSGIEGEADMSQVKAAAHSLGEHTPSERSLIVVNKSTMPIGTGDWMLPALERASNGSGARFRVVSNPEFLREGSAVDDFRHPDRVVLGGTDPEAIDRVAGLYRDLQPEMPIIKTDIRTAEMIKYASNAFLATKISFINEIASICERLGADVKEVSRGMGLDRRISPEFLDAGVGYGGSCFPKDVKALAHMASMSGAHPQLLRAVMEINRDMRRLVLQKVRGTLGSIEDRTIGVLGLAFKPNTDDLRESPAVEIIHLLQSQGARVKAFDPAANDAARSILPGVELCKDAYAVAEDAEAVILLTPWSEFRRLDLERVRHSMRYPLLVDGRNLYDPSEMVARGFFYQPIGRPGADPLLAEAPAAVHAEAVGVASRVA
ncbi:MAG: UDP-glucose/GDP-mannose dehydrogenase family protein [Chloroflexi bacterium]|nr:UDP-glucose/GDP-mannose dehydrogenase family protein [Chloroflexota bacterium]MBV9600538.1 UDP-glucose/GDP-mannose dehydrogenase family protein [Chloroflexota bacterium]